jgi:hypothetical protein
MSFPKEWYTVCSDNDIILSQCEDTHDFKITFNVLEKYETIVEIIQQNQFFELAHMLNDDIIEKYTENNIDNKNNVILKINTKDLNINNNIYNNLFIVLDYSKNIDKNICQMKSISSNNKLVENNEIQLEKFSLLVSNNNSKTTFDIEYTIYSNDMKNLNVSEKFMSLYLKKIFYRIKQYFD